MRVLIDTNVLVRVAEPGHLQHSVANSAIHALREAKQQLCLVPQVHYEFWSVVTRPVAANGLGMSSEQADDELGKLASPLFRLLRDERVIYSYWRELAKTYSARGKNAHDARLVAAMLRHGIRQILTFNTADFKRYREIEVIDPRDYEA